MNRTLPVPSMVERVKFTSLASIAPAGVVVIVMHTSTIESFSETIAMEGIEKEAATERRMQVLLTGKTLSICTAYHRYPQGL